MHRKPVGANKKKTNAAICANLKPNMKAVADFTQQGGWDQVPSLRKDLNPSMYEPFIIRYPDLATHFH